MKVPVGHGAVSSIIQQELEVFADLLALAEKLLHHPHDLMHKAIGWMLRELGKRDRDLLVQFLEKHRLEMPRTMLRYAIEKFSPEERANFLSRD